MRASVVCTGVDCASARAEVYVRGIVAYAQGFTLARHSVDVRGVASEELRVVTIGNSVTW